MHRVSIRGAAAAIVAATALAGGSYGTMTALADDASPSSAGAGPQTTNDVVDRRASMLMQERREHIASVSAAKRAVLLRVAEVQRERASRAAERKRAAERTAARRAAERRAAEAAAEQAAGKSAGSASSYTGGDPRAIARAMMSSYGWSSSQFGCLDALWERESGWDPRASNPSTGAYGIPQALPGGKMASAGSDWETNPRTQIEWGLGYISGRYGSPCGAWDAFQSKGWY